jgi:hypothetical protein
MGEVECYNNSGLESAFGRGLCLRRGKWIAGFGL